MGYLNESQNYWDLRSHGFSDAINEELDSALGEQCKERFRTVFGEKPLTILDDGAGAGFYTVLLSMLGHRVVSIDYSEKMVERIIENMRSRGFKADAFKMDAQKLDFEDETFDAVVQRNVMWNLDHPEEAYKEIYRVLKPGGIFFIDDGNHYLSSHDPEYAREQEERRKEFEAQKKAETVIPGSHYRHNPENVDYTVIEKIAQQQPLSYQRRPQWDVNRMILTGFREMDVKIDGKGLPHHFTIIARKP